MSFDFAGNHFGYLIFIVGDFSGTEAQNSRQPRERITEKVAKIKIFPTLFKKMLTIYFFDVHRHLG